MRPFSHVCEELYTLGGVDFATYSGLLEVLRWSQQSAAVLIRDGLTYPFCTALHTHVDQLLAVVEAYYSVIRVDLDEVCLVHHDRAMHLSVVPGQRRAILQERGDDKVLLHQRMRLVRGSQEEELEDPFLHEDLLVPGGGPSLGSGLGRGLGFEDGYRASASAGLSGSDHHHHNHNHNHNLSYEHAHAEQRYEVVVPRIFTEEDGPVCLQMAHRGAYLSHSTREERHGRPSFVECTSALRHDPSHQVIIEHAATATSTFTTPPTPTPTTPSDRPRRCFRHGDLVVVSFPYSGSTDRGRVMSASGRDALRGDKDVVKADHLRDRHFDAHRQETVFVLMKVCTAVDLEVPTQARSPSQTAHHSHSQSQLLHQAHAQSRRFSRLLLQSQS